MQIMAELKFTGKKPVKTNRDTQIAGKGAEQLLQDFESLGHGCHFQGKIPEGKDYEMIKFLNRKYDLNIENITVLWTSHDFLFLILHEETDFI